MTVQAKQSQQTKITPLNKQHGVYSIEFALVGAVFFLLLFAVLEVGRLFFVWNVLTEASRRGARLATVCHFDHGEIS